MLLLPPALIHTHSGSFVALLLFVTFLDESLLERPLGGRQLVWWLGTSTVVLAACRWGREHAMMYIRCVLG